MLIMSIQIKDLTLHLSQGILCFIILIQSHDTIFRKQIPAYVVSDVMHEVYAFGCAFSIRLDVNLLCRGEMKWISGRTSGYDTTELRLSIFELKDGSQVLRFAVNKKSLRDKKKIETRGLLILPSLVEQGSFIT